MSNFNTILNECSTLVDDCEKYVSDSWFNGSMVETRTKRLGNVTLQMKEEKGKNGDTDFFDFKIIETSEPYEINFDDFHWRDNPLINKLVVVSGTLDRRASITSYAKSDDKYGLNLERIGVIIVSDNDDKALESRDDFQSFKTIKVDDILSAISNLDIKPFYDGFKEHEPEKTSELVKQKVPNKNCKN